MEIIEFIISDDNGKEYECYAEITGSRIISQTVYVKGVGKKVDKDDYGPKRKPLQLMEMNRKLIALDVIYGKGDIR